MSIKQKISDSIYEVYVEKYPENVVLRVYSGDYFSFSIIGFNSADGQLVDTPFDFSAYSDFNASIRFGNAYGKDAAEYTFDNSEIVLGKSNNANPEFDELHVTSKDALNYTLTSNYRKAWFDVEGVTSSGDKKTFIKVLLIVETDVTR